MIISAQDKIRAVKAVVEGNKSVFAIAKQFGVSSRSLFRWVKYYLDSPRHFRANCLVAKYVRGTNHPRAANPRSREAIRRLVVTHPEWGARRISTELSRFGHELGVSGVYDQLINLGVNTPNLRRIFVKSWSGPGRISSEIKLEVVKRVLEEGKGATEVCQTYDVPRRSLYNWLNRYRTNSNYGVSGTAIFDETYVSGGDHPRAVSPEIETQLLSLVVERPEFSVHKLAEQLPVSVWTVQRLLARNHLNLYEQRARYAQEQRQVEEVKPVVPTFIGRVKSVFEKFMPNLAPAPPPIVSVLKLAKKMVYVGAILVLIFFSAGWWGRLAASYTLPQIVGLTFATIALSSGMLFFLYSLKYYFTIALVLSYSQTGMVGMKDRFRGGKGFISWILGVGGGEGDAQKTGPVGLEPNLDRVKLTKAPMVCVQIPFYNEKNVAERAIVAACNLDYPNYEVIIADDSTDATTSIIRKYQEKFGKVTEISGEGHTLTSVQIRRGVILKHLHRATRSGFKGAALNLALKYTDPRVEFISIFDADFVPFPDSLTLFLKYFKLQNNMSENYEKSNVAAVQGYQWHVLNKSENWITRGVRTEYSGSYVIERAGTELYGGLKMISGSVYMIRRKPLEEAGWGTSITEDFELTLKLYNLGYKVVYTPYVQAPAECVSTLKRLVKQRMRWAEGHSFNIKQMMGKLFASGKLSGAEKFELTYLAPYYLQAFFFIVGTLAWLISETVFKVRLPFWTVVWGWSLVLTNMLSLPLVNIVGLFYEESEQRDYLGIGSFILLCYLVAPFQAYAAVKGFLEDSEGPWFRTPKTGLTTDVFTRGRFYRLITGIFSNRGGISSGHAAQLKQVSSVHNFAFSDYVRRVGIRPRNLRYLSKLVTVILLVISMNISYLAAGVSLTSNQEYMGKGQKLSLSPGLVKPVLAQTGSGGGGKGLGVVQINSQTKPENFYLEDSTKLGQFTKPYLFTDESGKDVGTQYRVRLKSASGYQEFVFTDDEAGVRLYENGNVNARVDTSEFYIQRYETTGTGDWMAVDNTAWTMKAFTESNKVVIYRLVDIQGAVAGVMAQEHVLGFDGQNYIRKTSVKVMDAGFDKAKITGAADLATAKEYFNSYVSSDATWLAEAHRMSWDLTGINEITTDAADVKSADGGVLTTKEYGNLIIDWADFGQDIKLDEAASSKKAQVWFVPTGKAGDLVVDPTLSLTTSSTTVQVDVANRYRMIMNTGDTADYMTWYDRAQNDSTPNATYEFFGPCITETSLYCLRDDANRRTTLLEVSATRVRVRVEGKFNNEASTDYLDDESATPLLLTVIEDYTFTTEGVYVENKTDFRDTGVTLDAASGHNGYEWLGIYSDVTDAAFDDTATPTVNYGDGNTESNTSTDGVAIANTNTYIHLPGTGTSTYQDAFIGIQRTGWYDDTTGGTHQWYWDENETRAGGTTQDLIAAQEQNHLTKGMHRNAWYFLMLPETSVDTEAEREAYNNDNRNPDILTYTTGSEWNDMPVASTGINFDGSNDYIDRGTGPSAVSSVEFWVYPETTTEYFINLTGTSDYIWVNAGTVTATGFTSATIYVDGQVSSVLVADRWQHVAVTSSTSENASNLDFGRTADANYLEGKLDEVRLWSDVRTQTEIQENMVKQISAGEAGLVGYWRFNENTGTITYDETTNNNDGTFGASTAAPTWTIGYVPNHYNSAEGAYAVAASGDNINVDIDGQANVSTTLNGALTAGATTVTVGSTTTFPSSGVAYIDGDKFSYTGTTATTFTGVPSTGELSVIGHATSTVVASMNRYKPVYKVKGYRQNTEPASVSLEGSTLTDGTDYNLDFKPVSSSYWAQDILWATTFESDVCTSVDVGSVATSCTQVESTDYVAARYGNGLVAEAADWFDLPMADNINLAKGAVEFWMKPNFVPTDGVRHDFFTAYGNPSTNAMRIRKTAANILEFKFGTNGTDISYQIASGNFSWNVGDWIHIRMDWDDSAALANQMHVYINGVEPTHTDSGNDYNSANFISPQKIRVPNWNENTANVTFDELRIYGGSQTTPVKLAEGGDTADADEYLNDSTNDYTFSFAEKDSLERGEYLFFGSDAQVSGINVDLATLGVGSDLDLNWEYWNGTAWADLEAITGFTDSTSNLTADGAVYWSAIPTNWRPYSVNGSPDLYYIRASLDYDVSLARSYSTSPIEDTIKTDILILQYLSNISTNDQTMIVVPEYALLFTPIVGGLVYLYRKKRKKRR